MKLSRHFSCEPCEQYNIKGGFDSVNNQVIYKFTFLRDGKPVLKTNFWFSGLNSDPDFKSKSKRNQIYKSEFK